MVSEKSSKLSSREGIAYIVVDDDTRSSDRVRLPAERPDRYDASFYADLLIRAATSVAVPPGGECDVQE